MITFFFVSSKSLHSILGRKETKSLISCSLPLTQFLLFLSMRGIPLSMSCITCSICFPVLQITVVTPILQNVRDRGKRGLLFNTSRGTGALLKTVKETSEKNCQERQWNFNYRIWILAGLFITTGFVALGNHLLSLCLAAIRRRIGKGSGIQQPSTRHMSAATAAITVCVSQTPVRRCSTAERNCSHDKHPEQLNIYLCR